MSVNTLNVEQVYTLLNSLHEQATGEQSITPTSTADFVSMAMRTLAVGRDKVLNELTQMIGKTIISSRPYSRKFKGLEMDSAKWGAIVRKISFADRDATANNSWNLTDGSSVDQYTIRKPDVLETRYVGSDTFEDYYTVFLNQLDLAFTSEAEFARFVAGLTQHMSNKFEQYMEELSRMALCNFIGAKNSLSNSVVHLLAEYNAKTGLSLTATTVYQPANYPAFVRWLYSRIGELSDKMTERSELFQVNITGKEIKRHTPVADQKIYLLSEFVNEMETMAKSVTYHDSFLNIADVEKVGYWQAINDPDEIQVTPVYMDTDGSVATAAAQTMSKVVGVMFDRDAIGINIYDDRITQTPFNAAGDYSNVYHKCRAQFCNDLTEKGIVLVLD